MHLNTRLKGNWETDVILKFIKRCRDGLRKSASNQEDSHPELREVRRDSQRYCRFPFRWSALVIKSDRGAPSEVENWIAVRSER